jgi:ribosomal protein L29
MSKLKERRHEIQAMDQTQAQKELAELQRKLFDLRLQKTRGEVKNNRQFAQTRVDIARLKFHLSELLHAEIMAGELEAEETANAAQEETR